MCGRFVSSSSPEKIAEYFGAETNVESLGQNFNVAPTNDIYGVVETPDGKLELQVFHWGLIPVWAKDRKVGQKMAENRAKLGLAGAVLLVVGGGLAALAARSGGGPGDDE